MIAPLLLIRARPMRTLSHLFSAPTRRDLGRFGSRIRRFPAFAGAVVVLHISVWWLWHVPVLYDAAIINDLVHSLEHLALFLALLSVWWLWHVPVLYVAAIPNDLVHSLEPLALFAVGVALFGVAWPAGPVRQQGGVGLFMVFTAALGTGALSALITFSPN